MYLQVHFVRAMKLYGLSDLDWEGALLVQSTTLEFHLKHNDLVKKTPSPTVRAVDETLAVSYLYNPTRVP
jgi:hypothetical protein